MDSKKGVTSKRYTQQEIDKIINDLLDWAYEGEGIYIASYLYKNYKKPKKWLHDLARSHEDVEKAIEYAKDLIAARVANHCFKGDRNSTFGEKILPIYCKEYKALKQWQAELGKDGKEQTFDGTLAKLLDLMKEAKK